MEQEARTNDMWTMISNYIEQPSSAIQNSQSNNNNSNPLTTIQSNPISNESAISQTASLPENSQVGANTTRALSSLMTTQMLEIGGQSQSVGTSAPTTDEMSEMSAFVLQNFQPTNNTVSNSVAENLIADGNNHIGMVDEVNNIIDGRMPYSSNALDFQQNPATQAILDALHSIDKDSFGDGCGPSSNAFARAELSNHSNASIGPSFVSMLQNQPQVDNCNTYWPMNLPQSNPTVTANFNNCNSVSKSKTDINNSQQMTSNGQPSSCHNGHLASVTLSAATQELSQLNLVYISNPSKSTTALQHSTRVVPASRPSNNNQHCTNGEVLSYDLLSTASEKIRNDLMMPMGTSIEDRSREKMLTTTPIPSDKSSDGRNSSSSSSSGSDQSPDHVVDRSINMSNKDAMNSLNRKHTKSQSGSSGTSRNPVKNANGLKNYPCYRNANLMHFNTINFSPVMDSLHMSNGETIGEPLKKTLSNSLDMTSPVPTSDSVVEIDETVTSPQENIPVSPSTPVAIEHCDTISESVNYLRVTKATGSSYSQLRSANNNSIVQNKTNLHVLSSSHMQHQESGSKLHKNAVNMNHQEKRKDENNNNTLKKNSTEGLQLHDNRIKEKQRKQRISKHQRQKPNKQIIDKDARRAGVPNTDAASGAVPQSSNLRPKVNADPTKKKVGHLGVPHSQGTLSVQQRHINVSTHLPKESFSKSFISLQNANTPSSHYAQESKSNYSQTLATANTNLPRSTIVPIGRKVQQWQTVTAVQGPKLPPVLSEQDRIPKRGRPSKKMMQENLRVKTTSTVTDKVTPAAPVVTQASLSQPMPPASGLVSMYTINDKGLMEEIAPKLKDNKRSKERVQAFQNLLAEIRSSSEKRMSSIPKFGEKGKQPSNEKQIKKRAKPRTKVFGRPTSQPMSESGITQTMCTFSELAQQFKISDSIVSRATENLLRSAAVKRNKDQLQAIVEQNSSLSQKSLHSHKDKGVPSNHHCENVNKIASQPTSLSNSTRFQGSVCKSSSNENVKKLTESGSCQDVSTTESSSTSSLNSPNILPHVAHLAIPQQPNLTASSDVTTSFSAPALDPEVAEVSDTSRTTKSKRKKKKHKKHKKHKYAESKNVSSSKKKKKDKKKKEKKKLKSKLAVPSTTALVANTKSLIKNRPSEKTIPNFDKGSAVNEMSSPPLSKPTIAQDSNKRFSSSFRQTVADMSAEANDDTMSWPNEDQTYDGEDSSSDGEISTSHKSFVDSALKTSAATSDNASSFAQYSNSTLGFGMFHNHKSSPFQEHTDESNKVVAVEGNKSQTNVYGTSGGVRSRKHHKHKRRKPYRKSKNICDPAFLVLLDQVLFHLKNLKLTTTMLKPVSTKQTTSNIFFATMSTESVHDLVWKSPSKPLFNTAATKTDSQLGIVRGTAFKNDVLVPANPVRKSYSKLTDLTLSVAKTNPTTSVSSKAVSSSAGTISFFCCSPFFQKYGYVNKTNENISTDAKSISTAPTSTRKKIGNASLCVSTQSLAGLLNTPEKSSMVVENPEAPILKQKVVKSGKHERRKRGWPLGKPRGPRTKKLRIEESARTAPGITPAFVQMDNAKTDINASNNYSMKPPINKASNSPSDNTQNIPAQSANSKQQQIIQNEVAMSIVGTSKEGIKSADKDQKKLRAGKDIPAVNVADSAEKSAELRKNLEGVVSESLLKQIKQAIEASLSAIPSVNKDAITKSVDDAVLSYLEGINNTTLLENRSTEGDSRHPASEVTTSSNKANPVAKSNFVKKKSTKRNFSKSRALAENNTTNNTVLGKNNLPNGRSSAEKHPKKVWANKHQDTEIQIPAKLCFSSAVPNSPASTEPESTKRRTGRPKRISHLSESPSNNNVNDIPSLEASLPGKLPTASATVLPPRKQRNANTTISFKQPMRRPVGRPKKAAIVTNDIGAECNYDLDTVKSQITKYDRNSVISKEQARSSVAALQTLRSMQVKSKITHYNGVKEPGFYEGTDVEDHIVDAIETTVSNYEWDGYKEFEAACLKMETDGGFMEEGEVIDGLSDGRRKIAVTKKSIESVVEKLKSKQAQNIMHNAATALLQLHEVHSLVDQANTSDNGDMTAKSYQERRAELEDMKRVARRHDIYEKIITTKKNLNHINKILKVKKTQRSHVTGNNLIKKRPRGRPRKNPISDDFIEESTPPAKKAKTSHVKAKQKKTKSSNYFNTKRVTDSSLELANTQDKRKEEFNPILSPLKPYLEAGLYSSTFKHDERCTDIDLLGDSNAPQSAFPPPLDSGLYLRSVRKDFQLPYDIWWLYKHHKIAANQEPSTKFIEITENVYTSPRQLSLGDHICTCKVQDNTTSCGKQCLNRLMYIECSPASCPCKNSCSNQVIQKRQWCPILERFKTSNRGWGIRTKAAISEGTFVMEYVGEVLNETEFRQRTVELYHAYNDHYCVQLDTSTVIDGYRMANEGRFVNHSCEPNCEMQKWCVSGEYRIGLFTLRRIESNEELTYDYNFHAFNVNDQQECRCGSHKCRGVIGGKAQRLSSEESDVSLSVTTKSKNKQLNAKALSSGQQACTKDEELGVKEFSVFQMKPLSVQEQLFIRKQQLFLIRNLTQVRKREERQQQKITKLSATQDNSSRAGAKSKQKKGQHDDNTDKIASALKKMYTAITKCKDQNGVRVVIPFMNLPSKKKNPEYYERISDPIDLSIIEHNIMTGHYKDLDSFDGDVQKVFKNAEKYHGRKSTLGKDVIRLRKAYASARESVMLQLNGHKKDSKIDEVSDEEIDDEGDENIHRKNEDYIRCICNIYRDEGLMVQCEKCYVWQHCDCMEVKPDQTDKYLCEECDPRPYSKEVKVIPPPPDAPPGHTYYVTLLRDNLLVKQGDCAYLMRETHLQQSNSALDSNRNTADIPKEQLDIFRIEKLWTDERGDKYAYGHHFLRPYETHHAPNRTFYRNELLASPFIKTIPLNAVAGLCVVMDRYTYCKGKPKDFELEDIFICEYRVDKNARMFTRVNKKRYPICTKPHVFEAYKHKLSPKKNFSPHQVPEHYKKSSPGRPALWSKATFHDDDGEELDKDSINVGEFKTEALKKGPQWRKRQRLNGIAYKLLNKLPKQAIDVSYLLEPGSGKRQRKKTLLSLESLSQQK